MVICASLEQYFVDTIRENVAKRIYLQLGGTSKLCTRTGSGLSVQRKPARTNSASLCDLLASLFSSDCTTITLKKRESWNRFSELYEAFLECEASLTEKYVRAFFISFFCSFVLQWGGRQFFSFLELDVKANFTRLFLV